MEFRDLGRSTVVRAIGNPELSLETGIPMRMLLFIVVTFLVVCYSEVEYKIIPIRGVTTLFM